MTKSFSNLSVFVPVVLLTSSILECFGVVSSTSAQDCSFLVHGNIRVDGIDNTVVLHSCNAQKPANCSFPVHGKIRVDGIDNTVVLHSCNAQKPANCSFPVDGKSRVSGINNTVVLHPCSAQKPADCSFPVHGEIRVSGIDNKVVLHSGVNQTKDIDTLRKDVTRLEIDNKLIRLRLSAAEKTLDRFSSCQKQGQLYSPHLGTCKSLIPKCIRSRELITWDSNSMSYQCSNVVLDVFTALQNKAAKSLKGDTARVPGLSCRDIKRARHGTASGTYWIDPTGSRNKKNSFQVYCDMLTDGGGWTLVTVVKAVSANYVKKYPVNGMNEDRLMADRSDDWASLSKTRLNQIYNAYGDSILRLYTSRCCCNNDAQHHHSRTFYIKKMGNRQRNFNAFHAIRYVPEWGNKQLGEYKVNYYWDGRINFYNPITHDFPDSGRTMQHWDLHQVIPNGVSYTVSRHGIPGDVSGKCEWIYVFNKKETHTELNGLYDANVYAKIWIK